MTVFAVIPIVKPEFSEICLPHPSTTAPLMFLPISKNFPNNKSLGHTRKSVSLTDFDRKVNKFSQNFAKCDLCLTIYYWQKIVFEVNKFESSR